MMSHSRAFCSLLIAAFLAACSQGGGLHALPPGTGALPMGAAGPLGVAPAGPQQATVHLHFKIPASGALRESNYLSPSTASIQVKAFNAANTQVARVTQNTAPGASDCTAVKRSSFTCSFALRVPAGPDTFDVFAFDRRKARGKKLSAITDFPYTAVAGKRNNVAMTLGGIPKSLEVTLAGSSPFATGSAATGFQFGGSGNGAAQQLQLTAKDADGNIIINPGAPTFTLTSDAPKKLSVSATTSLSGRFIVTPLAETNALPVPNPSTAVILAAKATPIAGTGANPVLADVSVQNDPIVYEFSYDTTSTVQAYAPWSSSPIFELPSALSGDVGITTDSGGNVYVCNETAGTVTVFPPGNTTPSRTITGLSDPCYPNNIAVDAKGDIIVPLEDSNVVEYTPASGNTPARTMTNSYPAVALDASGNIFVANYDGAEEGVSVFAAGSTSSTPAFTFNAGMSGPFIPAFDSHGNLYVLNYSGRNVTEYKPPFSSASAVAQTFGSSASISTDSFGLVVDGAGNVYVGNDSSAAVTEFSPASPTTLVRTLASGDTGPIAVDPLGNVYVGAYSLSALNVYPPGLSTTPIISWTNGATDAWIVDVWP
jgi:hypothetical protein